MDKGKKDINNVDNNESRGNSVIIKSIKRRKEDSGFKRIKENEFRIRIDILICDGSRNLRNKIYI